MKSELPVFSMGRRVVGGTAPARRPLISAAEWRAMSPADRLGTMRLRARARWATSHPLEAMFQHAAWLAAEAAKKAAATRARLRRR